MSIRLGTTEVQEYLNMTVYEGGSIDLSNYYTKSEVDGMISNIDVSGQLKNYALKTDIPSLEGYATESYVNSKITALVNTAPEALDTLNELSLALGNDPNFATTIATSLGLKANRSDVYVKSEVYNKNEMDRIIESIEIDGSTDLSGYAKLTDIPTKTSQLTNDSGFLTEHQSLAGYATESWVEGKLKNVNVDLSEYAKKTEIPTNISQLVNDKNFITSNYLNDYTTKTYVDTQISTRAEKSVVDEIKANEVEIVFSTEVIEGASDLKSIKVGNDSYNIPTPSIPDIPTIVYSSTEPSNPTTGMIWLKPV